VNTPYASILYNEVTMQDHSLDSIDSAHHIQREILLQLRQGTAASYQQLKPDGLEGNAYNYHLKLLKQAGLISSEEGHYHLTSLGILVTDAYSSAHGRLVLRPHYYVYPLVTSGDQVLVYRPSRQPAPGRLVIPSGKLHLGDSIVQGIERELTRRGLSLDSYSWHTLCVVNIRYKMDGEVILHRPGTIYHIEYDGPLAVTRTESGESYWMRIDDVLAQSDTLPDLSEGLQRLRAHGDEPIDLVYDL